MTAETVRVFGIPPPQTGTLRSPRPFTYIEQLIALGHLNYTCSTQVDPESVLRLLGDGHGNGSVSVMNEPPSIPGTPTGYCRACAASGVGACDDFPDCQKVAERFYEDDEDRQEVIAAFDAGTKGVTARPQRPPAIPELNWVRDSYADAAYAKLPGSAIARTVPAGPDVNFDVDWTGKPIGIEVLNSADWVAQLVKLFMRGEMRLVHGFDEEAVTEPARCPECGHAGDEHADWCKTALHGTTNGVLSADPIRELANRWMRETDPDWGRTRRADGRALAGLLNELRNGEHDGT